MIIDKSNLNVVTSYRLFIDNNFEMIDEEGLLSQKLFGPKNSWHCACGKLTSKTLYENVTCDKCGVICGSNELRYTTFCKIVLPLPIYKNTMQYRNLLRKTIKKNEKHILDPIQYDLSVSKLLYFDVNQIKVVSTYDPQTCLPFRITGIYSLYLAIKINYEVLHNQDCKQFLDCFDHELLVTPPGIRFVTVKPNDNMKQIIQHPTNRYYSMILRYVKLDWQEIGDSEQNEKELIEKISKRIGDVDVLKIPELTFYDGFVAKYQYFTNLIYKEVIKSLSGKDGSIRHDFLGKTIDFSSRAHISIDPSLRSHEIKVSKETFSRLYFVEYLHYLNEYKNYDIHNIRPSIYSTESKLDADFLKHIDEFIEFFFNSKEIDENKKLVLINRQPTLNDLGASYSNIC